LIVATDRISAFDCILPSGIPHKGAVLTGLSAYGFSHTKNIVPNHFLSSNPEDYAGLGTEDCRLLRGRSMLVRKARRIDIECVVRGYISGSAWKEYHEKGRYADERCLQLKESDALPQPIFTPAIKSGSGHDQNISTAEMGRIIGKELTEEIMNISFQVYEKGAALAKKGKIILADSKYEYGILDGEIILIDELHTPDSSRFWDAEKYSPGGPQESFDKQFVRDYLESIKWDKKPPAPKLPDGIIEKTEKRYLEAYRRITGSGLLHGMQAHVN